MWIGIAVVAAVLYGLINDQITITISAEYFATFKRDQFAPVLQQVGLLGAPTRIQAVIIGALAAWWYGLFLGIVLGISSVVGHHAPLSTRRYVRAIGGVMAITFCISVLFGGAAYITEPLVRPDAAHWPFLGGIRDVRRAYAVGWWHNGAYLGALAATILASFWAQRQRRLG
jgi:hypothetical protein